jgi:hypothetical protein
MSDVLNLAADGFARWVEAADRIRGTTKRLEKLAALENYLPTLDDSALAVAAHFFSGIVFPRHDQRTTQVGGSILWNALAELTGANEDALAEAYTRHGDAGDMVGDVLAGRPSGHHSLAWMAEQFASLGATSCATRSARSAPTRRVISPSCSAASCVSGSRRRRWKRRWRARSAVRSPPFAMPTC